MQTTPLTQPAAPALRPPLSFRIAGSAWIVAGVIVALGPLLVWVLLQAQYASLRREGMRYLGIIDGVDRDDLLQLERYLESFESIERGLFGSLGTLLLPVIIGYAAIALLMLGCYVALGVFTLRGAHWARITGTVLSAVSAPFIVAMWVTVLTISWLPVNALWANHIWLAVLALHTVGVVCAWLPSANRFVRERALPTGRPRVSR